MTLYRFKFLIYFAFSLGLALIARAAFAMEPGTILYRTSGEGKMYGYSSQDLLAEKFGIINHIYPGHAAIYIGQEDGVDYIVEALGTGIVKTPAKYFINEAEGEELVAAKIPAAATPWQRARAVALAKYLAGADLAYDFDFSAQKGPWSGDWTCVGLTEKLYESANANNPERLGALEYDSRYYAVDITPDGYDNDSFYNDKGDCFSARREFSKIARRKTTILPAPEIIGYNAGKEYGGERYIFLPYTQALQSSLKDVPVDITLSSDFSEEAVRGKVNTVGLILKWSLINNPVSSIKKIAAAVGNGLNSLLNGKSESSALVWDENAGPNSSESKSKLVSAPLSVEKNPVSASADTNYPVDSSVKPPASSEKNPEASDSINKPDTNLSADVFSALRPSSGADASPSEETAAVLIKISTSTVAANSQTKTNVALWSPVVQTLNTAGASSTPASSPALTENNNSNNQTEAEDAPLTLVISRLYTAGNDDWLEIWNYGENDIDLAARKIRLEKSRTALDPGIILRFDAAADGEFPGGTIIRAGAPYRIVRDDAAPELKAAASAIALRPDFTLMDDGYTIYLASGAVSSPDDADIIDILAYGEAKYFDGSGPAPALSSGYLLRRKALATTVLADILKTGEQANWPPIYDNDDNAHDFLLWPLGGAIPNEEEGEEEQDNNQNNNETENNGGNQENSGGENELSNGNNNQPFTLQPGIDSPGLQYLWSFYECAGSSTADMINTNISSALVGGGQWMIGRWGCGRRISYNGAENFQVDLSPVLSGSNFSFAFQYKGDNEYGHPYFVFSNTDDNVSLRFEIFATMFSFTGFPGLDGRYDANGYMDNTWHQGILVWNAASGYWGIYIDGQEMFFQNFSGLAPDFNNLQIGSYAGVVTLDDVALWNRALSQEEIIALANANQPFNPQVGREAPPSINLLHSWQFDEASGNFAHDSVGNLNWALPEGALVYNGLSGKALSFPPIGTAYNLAVPAIDINNFSASWWWQNNAVLPYSGRLHLDFNQGEEKLVSLALDNWQQRLWTERNGEFFQEGHEVLPEDNLWHHLALVYDDYRYLWQLFVDGELKLNLERLPLPAGAKIDNLSFRSSVGDYMIDNFKLWQGSLSADKLGEEYAAEKPE